MLQLALGTIRICVRGRSSLKDHGLVHGLELEWRNMERQMEASSDATGRFPMGLGMKTIMSSTAKIVVVALTAPDVDCAPWSRR